ncbi:MAG: glycosyltransferase family 2 protein [Lachnospira sp.]|nr:glycosyltransferase family 2 protein [Lachnospira sp.]
MSRVGFVLLHYGDVSVTKECIDSILQLETKDMIHIVVVDNDWNKPADKRELLQSLYAGYNNITIIPIMENRGFSYANNQGYQYLKKHYEPQYIVISNNDILFCQKDFLSRLQESHEQEAYAVLAPDIIGRDSGEHQNPIDTKLRTKGQASYTIAMNRICLTLFPIVYPFIRGRFQKKPVNEQHKEILQRVDNIVPCGACLVLSKEFIEQEIKVFYPETQFYYEEYILYYNCQNKGYRIVYDPSIQVIHGDGVATKKKTVTDKGKIKFIMKHTMKSAKIYKKLISTNNSRG